MKITQKSTGDLNALLTVKIEKKDYEEKVDEVLRKYRKTADVKGFRKGHVPMNFIKKKFEKGVIFEEVNQLLSKGINDYIQEKKVSILGNPLPVEDEDFDWDADPLKFQFELGLAPEFEIDLSKIEAENYKIKVSEEDIQKYVDNFANQYGSIESLDKVEEGDINMKVQITELDKDKKEVEDGVNRETYLFVDELANSKKFIGKKVGDKIVVEAADLTEKEEEIARILEVSEEEAKEKKGSFEVEIKEISKKTPSPINQYLFDKVYGEGTVKTEKEFRDKIREESEKMYESHTDREMLNNVVEQLIKEIKFDLPNDFLSKWLHFSNEDIDSIEEAAEQLKKEEEGLRYQLIENKLADNHKITVEYPEVEEMARQSISNQLKMYGQVNLPEETINSLVQSSMQNEQEVKRMSNQVFANKLLKVFKDNLKFKTKEITFDEFVEMMDEKHDHHHHHNHVHNHDHNHEHDHEHQHN